MNLYSYSYLIHSSNVVTNIFIGLAIILGLVFIFYGFKYLRNRTNLRYRNVLIAVLAFASLLICIQVNRIQDLHSTKSQVGETVQVMKNISHQQHISLKHIYSSSSNFTSGMLIKANKHYYTVDANSDNSAYHLNQAQPASNQVHYITHHNKLNFDFHWNINNNQYWNIALKFLVGFILFVLQINLLGKNNLAPNNAVDQIENYILGGIVGGIIYNPAITFLQFVIIILMWSVIVFSSKILTDNSNFCRNFIEGKPQVIINNGQIDVDTALKSGLSANDIVFKLRDAGVKDYQDVKRVILEQNGRFRVERTHSAEENYPIILDGKINTSIVKRMHHSRRWVIDLLKLKKKDVRDVFLGQIIDGQLVLTDYPKHKIKFTKFTPHRKIDLKEIKEKLEEFEKQHKH